MGRGDKVPTATLDGIPLAKVASQQDISPVTAGVESPPANVPSNQGHQGSAPPAGLKEKRKTHVKRPRDQHAVLNSDTDRHLDGAAASEVQHQPERRVRKTWAQAVTDNAAFVVKTAEKLRSGEQLTDEEAAAARAIFAGCESGPVERDLLHFDAEKLRDAVTAPPGRLRGPPADPMALLLAAQNDGLAPVNWNFATPALKGSTPNMKILKQLCADAEKKSQEADLDDPTKRDDLLMVVQAGMGIGKSHLIDIAQELFFTDAVKYPDQAKKLMIKVTYNRDQKLGVEGGNGRTAEQGLLARIVMAVQRKVSPASAVLVSAVLELRELEVDEVANYLIESAKGPIIIGIDEVSCLSRNGDVLKAIVNTLTQLVKALRKKKAAIVGIITALPSLDIYWPSTRPLIPLRLPALTVLDSRNFFYSVLPPGFLTDRELEEVHHSCGGHPRSLAVAAVYIVDQRHRFGMKKIPSTEDIYDKCMWSLAGDDTAGEAAIAIVEMYNTGKHIVDFSTPIAQKLYNQAMMMKIETYHSIPPTVLFCDPTDTMSLYHIRSAFQVNAGEAAAKALEDVNHHWDFFRRQHRMPVVPPRLRLKGSPGITTTAHSFMFDPEMAPVTAKIMRDKETIAPAFKGIDNLSYYIPASVTHPHFESMYVAESRDGKTHTLVLFQSNINADVPKAVAGLCQAAAVLSKKVWKGEFLFVIFALAHEGGSPAMSECQHPIIFVTKENLADYFTATVAPAARLHHLRRQRPNTMAKVAAK
jgi:hypothetical protein